MGLVAEEINTTQPQKKNLDSAGTGWLQDPSGAATP